MPAFWYISTERTMPTSKHSNSGRVPHSFITAIMAVTLSTWLSNSMGGQAHWPLSLIFR